MISRAEIEKKAQEFEINTANVERDYIFGWILFGIFTISDLKDVIFLKGGNALRKGYFANTRFSSDLDLGIPGDISIEVLQTEVNKICDFIESKTGITFDKDKNKIEEKFGATDAPIPGLKVYEARVYFHDFYAGGDHFVIRISMDITRFDKVMLPLQIVDLIHPYSDASEVVSKIRCMKLEEIIATKLKCLLQRQHAPDLFDYVYSIKLLGGSLDKEEVVKVFIQKTIFSRNPHVVKKILLEIPFDYFRNFWTQTIICAKQFIFEVEEAISFFIEDLENIFKIYPDNGFVQFAFFEPKLRVPIMKAGREQTILEIRYNGSNRRVEPYSLKYLQRKDGRQREYFYGYNCSGGSGQGVRCFVAENIESIKNTEVPFTPRFQIELSKAGEKPENPYLFDPNKPEKAKGIRSIKNIFKTKSRKTYNGPKYIYQCSYCGKLFTKHTRTSNLNPHKSKNGFPCNGRQGYYVNTKY